ncbi:hypothetical protein AgCh_010422 [Apium graveolens]
MGKTVKDGDAVKREQLIWTPMMDSAFIQSMLNQQYEGHRIDGTFTSQAYVNMVAEMRQKLNIELNKAHLKNRLKTLKDHFTQCYDLFREVGLSGFSWNSESKLFEATEDVWDQLITELFTKDRATGAGAETEKEKNKRRLSTSSTDWSVDDINDLLTGSNINLESLNNDDDVQFVAATQSPHEAFNSATEAKGKKRKYDEEEDINKGKKKKLEEEEDNVEYSTAGNDTGLCSINPRGAICFLEFLIYDDDEGAEADDEDVPNVEALLVDNTGWS